MVRRVLGNESRNVTFNVTARRWAMPFLFSVARSKLHCGFFKSFRLSLPDKKKGDVLLLVSRDSTGCSKTRVHNLTGWSGCTESSDKPSLCSLLLWPCFRVRGDFLTRVVLRDRFHLAISVIHALCVILSTIRKYFHDAREFFIWDFYMHSY